MCERTYLAIDLKSFYASVECRERGLDPMDTNLVVADPNRTEKTICLAVTPPLKAYGISGRARLFEVVQAVNKINVQRKNRAPGKILSGASYSAAQLAENPCLEVGYLIAPPRMAYYMEYSSRIYQVYLKYIAPEDIIVYSIDEVFMDVTNYLDTYRLSPKELARKIILDVMQTTGITATAGIGTNLFLCKVALDIVAKHIPADEYGVRIAQLDEMSYRKTLWSHRPLTDFWRVGPGYAKKLQEHGMFTMGDVARRSVQDEDLLYRLFGKNAELLIDHAWGWEPCTVQAVKAYRPSNHSIGSGQVLNEPYPADKARLVVREMAEMLSLTLVDKGLMTSKIVLTVGYDILNLTDSSRKKYFGPVAKDAYGRSIPKPAHGTQPMDGYTSSTKEILQAATQLFDRIVNPDLLIRRLNIVAEQVLPEHQAPTQTQQAEQLDFFTDYEAQRQEQEQRQQQRQKERRMQQALLDIKKKFGKNAILKGMNLQEGATAKERNKTIGGHKA